jgi:hypothetical protein
MPISDEVRFTPVIHQSALIGKSGAFLGNHGLPVAAKDCRGADRYAVQGDLGLSRFDQLLNRFL